MESFLRNKNYSDISLLGEGGYGKVYKCKKNKKEYAVKFQNMEKNPNFLELELLKHYTHQNLIPCEFDFHKLDVWYLVLTMPLGSSLKTKLSQEQKWKYIAHLANYMSYLHENNFYNCDLKPENIVLINDNLMVIDLGLAGSVYSTVCNTSYVRPLEFFEKDVKKHDAQKADSFAFGCVCAYLFCQKDIFHNDKDGDEYDKEVVKKIKEYYLKPVQYLRKFMLKEEEIEFIMPFLEKDPKKRYPIQKAFDFLRKKGYRYQSNKLEKKHSVYVHYDYNQDQMLKQMLKYLFENNTFTNEELVDFWNLLYRIYPFFQNKECIITCLFIAFNKRELNRFEGEQYDYVYENLKFTLDFLFNTGGIYTRTIFDDANSNQAVEFVIPFLSKSVFYESNPQEREQIMNLVNPYFEEKYKY